MHYFQALLKDVKNIQFGNFRQITGRGVLFLNCYVSVLRNFFS